MRSLSPVIRRAASAALLLGVACATGSQGGSAPKSNANVITRDELEAAHVEGSVLDAVRRLRPLYLTNRGAASSSYTNGAGETHVSLDGGSLQDLSALASLPIGDVREIRLLTASDAAQRFGVSAKSGAVIVVSRR